MENYYLNCTNLDSCSQVFKLSQEEFEDYTDLITTCPECKSSAILSVSEPLEVNYDQNEIDKLILIAIQNQELTKEQIKEEKNATNRNSRNFKNRST